MDTPRTRRTSTQVPDQSKVGQNYVKRTCLFSPNDSGLGNSPTTGTPPNVHTETTPGIRFRRNTGQGSPRNNVGRRVQQSEVERGNVNSWRKFWLVWVGLLSVCSGLVAVVWIYFPNNKVVQKSQEYVMFGLLALIGLIVFTIVSKLIWHSIVSSRGSRDNSNSSVATHFRSNESFNHYPDDASDDDTESFSSCEQHNDFVCAPKTPTVNWNTRPDDNRSSYPNVGTPGQDYGSNVHSYRATGEPDSYRAPGQSNEKPQMKCTNNDPVSDADNTTQIPGVGINRYPTPVMEPIMGNIPHTHEYTVRRTFSGTNTDVWNDFLQYFENLAELNKWNAEKSRRVLLSTLRGQAETYAYGMPLVIQRDYNRLKQKMEERFGHTAMKERYVTEAKLRKRQPNESLRDFGQAIEDLYRRAYPNSPEIVEESAIKSFLDKCGQSEDFRLAVKRTRPKTLQEAVLSAMQEECLRAGEKDLAKENKPVGRQVYEVKGDELEKLASVRKNVDSTEYGVVVNRNSYKSPEHNERDIGIGPNGRPYYRGNTRGRGKYPRNYGRFQNFRGRDEPRRDSDVKPLN